MTDETVLHSCTHDPKLELLLSQWARDGFSQCTNFLEDKNWCFLTPEDIVFDILMTASTQSASWQCLVMMPLHEISEFNMLLSLSRFYYLQAKVLRFRAIRQVSNHIFPLIAASR